MPDLHGLSRPLTDHAGRLLGPMSRRGFLGGMGGLVSTLALARRTGHRASTVAMPTDISADGLTLQRAALHVHGSFSEGIGNWAQHVTSALANGVSVMVPTDHDFRVQLFNYEYSGRYHFSGWSEQAPSGRYRLLPSTQGATRAVGSGAQLSAVPAPADTSAGAGSVRLIAKSTSATTSFTQRATVDCQLAGKDFWGTVISRSVSIWVLPNQASVAGSYLSLTIQLSTDPVYGSKKLVYRLRTDLSTSRPPSVNGGTAMIDVPVQLGQWSQVSIQPLGDIATAWPRLYASDTAMQGIILGATAVGSATADGMFSYLQVQCDPQYDGMNALNSVLDYYRDLYPQLLMPQGMEFSVDRHFNQIGGDIEFYPYAVGNKAVHQTLGIKTALAQVQWIENNGGVSSWNHPFGADMNDPTTITPSQHRALMSSRIAQGLQTNAWGATAMETGYVQRGGMSLADHQYLMFCMLANGMFLTATGVSDDHNGTNWGGTINHFLTLPWMSDLSEASLQTALRTGRCGVGLLGDFTGGIDLSINGLAMMGQAYIAADSSDDQLLLTVTEPPSGCSAQVLCGPVDLGGAGFEPPSVVTEVGGDQLALGPVPVPTSGTGDRYYQLNLLDPNGRVLAYSNPIWRLTDTTTLNVPPARAVQAT